jgi:hypothetical protein
MAESLPLDTLCLRRAVLGERVVCTAGWLGGSVLTLWGPVGGTVLRGRARWRFHRPRQAASHDLLRTILTAMLATPSRSSAPAGWPARRSGDGRDHSQARRSGRGASERIGRAVADQVW